MDACSQLTTIAVDPEVRSVRPKRSHKKVWRLLQTAWARCMSIFLGMGGSQASYRAKERMSSHENGDVEHPSTVVETFTNITNWVLMPLNCIRRFIMIQGKKGIRKLNPYIANGHKLSLWWRESRRRTGLHRWVGKVDTGD